MILIETAKRSPQAAKQRDCPSAGELNAVLSAFGGVNKTSAERIKLEILRRAFFATFLTRQKGWACRGLSGKQ